MDHRQRVIAAILAAIWGPDVDYGPDQIDEAYRITELVLAAINQTDDGAGPPPADAQGVGAPSAAESAIPAPSSSLPRAFQLIRHRDLSGVSGTGAVAEGVQFSDGTVALRWYGDHPATAVWPSLADVLAVHGHQGATVVRWFSKPTDPPIEYWPTEGGPQ